jgi:DNA-binding transcriptional LysR family regulator
MDRLYLMRVYVAVVDENSFAGAARSLKVSPPSVTRAIAELERLLGTRLLTRTTRVVRVTDAGARYVEDCRRILGSLAHADESLSGLRSSPRGSLILSAPVLFGARYVTPIVTEYLRRDPAVDASCWFLDRVVDLVEEGVDIAVRIGELPDSSMQAISVGRVRHVICASPAYLARHAIPRVPTMLSGHEVISSGGDASTPVWRFDAQGRSVAVRLPSRLTTTTHDSAIAAAVAGFGLVRLLSYQVADQLRQGSLATLLEEFEPPSLPVHLVHREGPYASLKVRAFLELAVERLRSDPALG